MERCPQCGARLQRWEELGAEEREVVLRLPMSATHVWSERVALHLWCTRCWYEAARSEPKLA